MFDDILDANFRAAYFAVQKALPLLSDGGAIVFTTSWFDEVGIAGTSAVSASKAALRNFTRTLASELIEILRVQLSSPGHGGTAPDLSRPSSTKSVTGRINSRFRGRVCLCLQRHQDSRAEERGLPANRSPGRTR
jgi:NAD(P)-dependent dehydrogenase (short-subunit alcohol dehydrogenase family)